jgi:hypothetical protein
MADGAVIWRFRITTPRDVAAAASMLHDARVDHGDVTFDAAGSCFIAEGIVARDTIVPVDGSDAEVEVTDEIVRRR